MASCLQASDDWIGLSLPPSAPQGQWEAGLLWSHAHRDGWALGGEWVRMRDSDGRLKDLRVMDLAVSLRWQAAKGQSLAATFPYVFRELSPSFAGPSVTYSLGDPALRRGDGTGDLSLEWRAALGQPRGGQGAQGGLRLGLTVPLGLGPMESQHPLVSTGGGRWVLAPGIIAGGRRGRLESWVEAGALWMLGQGADISQEAVIAYDSRGAVKLAPGRAYLGPRWGLQAGAGLAWDWHQEAAARQSLAVELRQSSMSSWVVDGQAVWGSGSECLELTPQLQARFERFSASAGWAYALAARNVAVATGGEWRLRLELAL